MENQTYLQKLADPKWKLKCKSILRRDNFKCSVCGKNHNLQVHHTFYYEDYPDPWLYPNESLLTLCKGCHHEYHLYHEVEIRKYPAKGKSRKPKRPERKKFKVQFKNRNSHTSKTKYKAGTTYIKVKRRISGEMREVLRKV